MASCWFYRIKGQETGPITFAEMVAMVRAGTLAENDRVRREKSAEWTPAWKVAGLFATAREASKAAQEFAEPVATESEVGTARDEAPTALGSSGEVPVEQGAVAIAAAGSGRARRAAFGGGSLIAVVVLATGLLFWSLRGGPKSQPKVDLEGMRGVVQAFQAFRMDGDEHISVSMVPDPLLHFRDVPQPNWDGTVWAWGEVGRPIAMLKLYRGDPQWSMNAISLSDSRVLLKGRTGWEWEPRSSGINFRPFPQAQSPSSEAAIRLPQIQKLASRFATYMIWEPNNRRSDLRLRAEMVHRYSDPHSGLHDGGIFIVVDGSNPMLAILIEAVEAEGKRHGWQYGIARLGDAEYHASLDGREVWKCNRAGGQRPGDSYFGTGEPMSP